MIIIKSSVQFTVYGVQIKNTDMACAMHRHNHYCKGGNLPPVLKTRQQLQAVPYDGYDLDTVCTMHRYNRY